MNRYLDSFFIAFTSYVLFGLFIFYFLINEKIIIEKSKNLQAISLNHIKIEPEIKNLPKNIVEDKIVKNDIQEEVVEEQEMEVEKIEEAILEETIEEKLEKKVEETPKKIIPKEIKKEVKKEIKKPIEKKKEITKKQIITKPIKEVKKHEITKKTEVVEDKIVNKDIQEQKTEIIPTSQINTNQVVNHKKAYLDENLVRIRNLINQNVKYPKRARKLSIEGIVTVKFKILENGSIENLIIIDGHKFLQNATIEAISEASKSFPKTNQSIEIQIPIEYKLI